MIKAEEIKTLIEKGLPGARVAVVDEAGDGEHFSATVTAPQFAGLTRVQQHQAVYGALGEAMRSRIHALQLTTSAT
ncbi:MAG TPA: BolA family transcriptional regulator [Myxococcota bacterium]|jgi:stress-induced morphogen|nr:BolA family transcriptional regulator [Myxococcota bacterium]